MVDNLRGMKLGQKAANTQFFKKWGCQAHEIATYENTTIDAVHMRVHKFGSPWQRRAKPTVFELIYAKTLQEISAERNKTPGVIYSYQNRKGDAYFESENFSSMLQWRDYSLRGSNTWLMEEHPEYLKWRNGELFPETYVKKGLDWQVVEKMAKPINARSVYNKADEKGVTT